MRAALTPLTFVLTLSLLSGCSLSHSIGDSTDDDAGVDGSSFDASRFDVSRRDITGRRDSGVRDVGARDTSVDSALRDVFVRVDVSSDTGPVDGGTPDTSSELPIRALPCAQFFGRIDGIIEWPSIDCGHVSDVQIVALADGRFLPIVTESRSCFDRPPQVLAQFITLGDDGLYVGSEEIVMGDAAGPAYAVAFGNEVAVCTGDQTYIRGADSRITRTRRPLAAPGCPAGACRGIAHDGEGWVLITDPPECAEGNAQIVRLDMRGEPRGESSPLPTRADAISSTRRGVEVIGSPLSGAAGRYVWPRAASVPDTVSEGGLRPNALVTGIGAWPFQDGARVIAVAHELGLFQRVISRRGEVVFENYRTLNPRQPTNVVVQPTNFGLVIALSYSPESNRGGEYIVSYIDEEGDAIFRAQIALTNAPSGRIQADFAWSSPLHLSHVIAEEAPLNRTRLFGLMCLDR